LFAENICIIVVFLHGCAFSGEATTISGMNAGIIALKYYENTIILRLPTHLLLKRAIALNRNIIARA